MFRVIYGRVFSNESEAKKAEKTVLEYSPVITSGKASYVVELGRYKTRKQADAAYFIFKKKGLRIFIQKLEDK